MEDAEKLTRYPAKATTERHEGTVKEASRLFRERGFGNVSVGEVNKAASLTHLATVVGLVAGADFRLAENPASQGREPACVSRDQLP